jgi:hypothetical protein
MSFDGSQHNTTIKNGSGTTRLSKFRLSVLLLLLAAALTTWNLWLSSNRPVVFLDVADGAMVQFNSTVLRDFQPCSSIPYHYCTPFSGKKPQDAFRVFLIGEASLSGWPYSEGQAIGGKIRNILIASSPETKFEIITISFAGLNSASASEIVSGIFRYSPDLVILYCGHNEFYSDDGSLNGGGFLNAVTPNFIARFFSNRDGSVPIQYDNTTDDLEVLMPLQAKIKLLNNQQQEYRRVVRRYEKNMAHIAAQCKEHNTRLIVSDLADNYHLPPLGISNPSDQSALLSADIIFNNARMALQRDGNETTASQLFFQSKELDAFRLRMPSEFSLCLQTMAHDSIITVAGLRGKFVEASQNHIPGSDLFVDYIHPNKTGLGIIAAEYARLIAEKCLGRRIAVTAVDSLHGRNIMTKDSADIDTQLEKLRIDKTMCRLKDAGI